MTVDLGGVPFGLVKNVDLLAIAEEHLMHFRHKTIIKNTTENERRTIMALTRVVPPSANEPGDCATDVDTQDAAEHANRIKVFIVVDVGPKDSRVV
jgi:hypothetical protein